MGEALMMAGPPNGLTVYVPRDSSALSVGAEEVASAIAEGARRAGVTLTLVRNGSRGAYWLEPLVEVATAAGRRAYGPVQPGDVPGLLAAWRNGGAHALNLGLTEELPYLKQQERLTFARVSASPIR
jgi:formate dehydrogenase iron-sulfur subunit